MLTLKRFVPPILPKLTGDWEKDGPNVIKAFNDVLNSVNNFLLSLEEKGSLAIDQAAIDGTVIGGASAAAGTFTDLTSTGNTVLGNASTDTLNVGNGGIIKDASGNVGIGVTPAAKLHAAGANVSVGSNDALVQFRTTTAQGVDVGASLQLGGMYDGSNSLGFAEISGRKENSTSGEWGGYLQLSTRQYGGSFAERMRITSTGNVGIGVTPSYALHLNSGQFAGPDGTAAAPTYSFASSGNADNGMYLSANNVVSVAIAGAKTATIQADRLEFASGYHVTSATATGTTPALQSGTYTPTLSNTTNITSSTANADAKWFRVGNIVHVSCPVNVRPAGAGSCVLGVSLPIASNLAASTELSGVGVWSTTIVGSVTGDTTNDRAMFIFTATVDPGVEAPTQIEFSYEVL